MWRQLVDARQLYRSRCELTELDAARRVDLGVTDDQIAAELSKLILGELSPWASLELRAAENDARRGAGPSPSHERSFYRSYTGAATCRNCTENALTGRAGLSSLGRSCRQLRNDTSILSAKTVPRRGVKRDRTSDRHVQALAVR